MYAWLSHLTLLLFLHTRKLKIPTRCTFETTPTKSYFFFFHAVTEHDIKIGKKLVDLQGLSWIPPNLMNFGPETAENGWWVIAHPSKFALGDTVSLTPLPHGWMFYSLTDSRQTLAQSTTKECRAGSRWSLPCI